MTPDWRWRGTRKTNVKVSSEQISAEKQSQERSCIPTAVLTMPSSIHTPGSQGCNSWPQQQMAVVQGAVAVSRRLQQRQTLLYHVSPPSKQQHHFF